jgi:hypothetical protein
MFNTRNKSGISAHPCIILYLFIWIYMINYIYVYLYWIALFVVNCMFSQRWVLHYNYTGVTGDSPPQEIRPPSQKGGDIPRIFAPPPGRISSFRNFAPPYEFLIFDLKTKRLQVEKIYCVIYLFITRRQNYIHILGFLAAGGVHSRHNHSFEVLRQVSYSTHLKWNHCPHRSHKIMLSYSSGSLHSHNIL